MRYIPGRGNPNAKLMVVGEAPTDKDSQSGQNFTGHHSLELFNECGIQDAWFTTVSKYSVPPSWGKKKIPFSVRCQQSKINLAEQINDLQHEINAIKPNCILALGGSALWALTGKGSLGSFRGSILFGSGTKVVSTYNPEHLSWQATDVEFKGYWNKLIMAFDTNRAIKQSLFKEYIVPHRTLRICRSSYELAEYLNKYKHCRKMAVDIEAHGSCLPACVGLAFNKSEGMTVPLWNKDDLSTIPDSDLVQMWLLLAEALWMKDIIGQNFNYDRDKLYRLGFAIRDVYSDTMMKAQALNPELPKGLAFNVSLYTEEPFYKDDGMYHGSVADLLIGCARDACVTYEVDEAMESELDEIGQRDFYYNFLMKLPPLYWHIEQNGMKVDPAKRDELLKKYIKWDEELRYELFKIVGTEVNVNSPKQIGILLFENFGLPRKDGTGEEEITALLNSPTAIKKPEHRRVCELILEGRRVRKSISTYLMALPDFDGRMRTTYFPCLDTGRSSTGQQDAPIRPSVAVIDENGKKKDKVLGIAYQTMTKHGDVGADIRGMYVPD